MIITTHRRKGLLLTAGVILLLAALLGVSFVGIVAVAERLTIPSASRVTVDEASLMTAPTS